MWTEVIEDFSGSTLAGVCKVVSSSQRAPRTLIDVTTLSHRKLEIHVPDMIDATPLFFSNGEMDTNNTTSAQTSKAKNLIEAVGSLPLAIVHAATQEKQTQSSLEDILQLYPSEHKGEVRSSMQPLHMKIHLNH
jgi:hypothetical protein